MTRTLAQMTLRDPQFRAIMNEHKQACLDMGFKEEDFNDTVEELRNRGCHNFQIRILIEANQYLTQWLAVKINSPQ